MFVQVCVLCMCMHVVLSVCLCECAYACGGGGVVKVAGPEVGRGLGESGATKMRAVLAPYNPQPTSHSSHSARKPEPKPANHH